MGKDLRLKLQVLKTPGCTPVEGAIVEIWHCDGEGIYSGYPEEIAHDLWKTLNLIGLSGGHVEPTNQKRFLRGALVTDANGEVEFETIFPGWYSPRAPHIHFKIVSDENACLTSQFYFAPEFSERVYHRWAPYQNYGPSPFTPANDVAIKEHQDAEGLQLDPVWSDDEALQVSAKIGIQLPT